jgi:hypothetical protein
VLTHALPQTELLPHGWHAPLTHAAPVTHWLLPEQLVKHDVVPHMNGLQGVVDRVGQLPRPSQTAGLVAVVPLQLGWRQVVSAPGKVQLAFVPLQVPWQRPDPAQAGWPVCGAPVT